jgi:hypothetical protein
MVALRVRPNRQTWWNRERVREGLRALRAATGQAPTDGNAYQRLIQSQEYTYARAAVRRFPGIHTIRRFHVSLWEAWADAGVVLDRAWQPWSAADLWYLREAVGIFTFAEIARDLSRTPQAVDEMAGSLGLSPRRPRGLWPLRSIATAIGRSERYTRARILESGIPIVTGGLSGEHRLRLVDPADLPGVRGIRWSAVSEELIEAVRQRLIARIVAVLDARQAGMEEAP